MSAGRRVTRPAAPRAAAALAAAALGLGALGGCSGYGSFSDGPVLRGEPAYPDGVVTVERVLDATEVLEGRTVTIDARVEQTISTTAATVVAADTGAGPLLVVHDPAEELVEGADVRVTGVVLQAFDLQDVEADLGVDLDDAAFERFAADPYMTVLAIEPAAS